MAIVVIRIAGQDITEHVIFDDAEFTSAAKGRAGTARFRIRDLEHEYAFSTGDSLTLDVDGIRKWGGFVGKIERGYFFEVDCTCKVPITPRYLLIDGVDYNVLLQKRVLYDKVDPTNMELTRYPVGTPDQTVLLYYLTNHTDLLADGVTTGLIESVGTPFVDDIVSGSASWTVDNFLRYLTSETGAIYYINPDKALVLTDVDTSNAPKGISDDPNTTEVGCRDLEIDFDGSGLRNDALAWGVGQGSPQPVFSRVTDSASLAEHGTWQVGVFNPTVWHQETIDRIADSYVYGSPQNRRGGKDDRTSVACTVFDPTFRVAQKVAFRSDVFGFSDVIPIRSETITFDTPTDPRFRLVLGHDIDDPWTTFEFWFPPFPPRPPFPELPGFPTITLPPNNPCPDGNCFDTFTRISGGGGISEFGGFTYTAPLMTRIRTDGANLVFSRDNLTGGIQRTYSPALPLAYPVDVTFSVRFGAQAPGDAANPFMGFEFWSSPEQAAAGEGGKGYLRFRVAGGYPTSFATLELKDVATSAHFSTVVFEPDFSAGYTFHVRLQVDDGGRTFRFKHWSIFGPEPDNWEIDHTVTSIWTEFGISVLSWQAWDSTGTSEYAWVDNFRVTQGLLCIGDQQAIGSYVESGDPFCLDDFNRGAVDGWGTGPCGTWAVDLASYEQGAYVDGAVGHFESQYTPAIPAGFNTSGPTLSLLPTTDVPSIWMATMKLTCVDRGARNRIDMVIAGAGSQFSEIGAHRIQFTLDPIGGSDVMNVIHSNVGSGGGLDTKPFEFTNGHQYRLTIVASDSSTAATIEDLVTGAITSGLAAGTKTVTNARFIVKLVQAFSPNQGELPSHFTLDDLEFRGLPDKGLTDPCASPVADDVPCNGQYRCEEMSPLVLGLSYQSTYPWVPGSDEVWVDGIRLDYRDYTAQPALRVILLDQTLSNTAASVRICYLATCT